MQLNVKLVHSWPQKHTSSQTADWKIWNQIESIVWPVIANCCEGSHWFVCEGGRIRGAREELCGGTERIGQMFVWANFRTLKMLFINEKPFSCRHLIVSAWNIWPNILEISASEFEVPIPSFNSQFQYEALIAQTTADSKRPSKRAKCF